MCFVRSCMHRQNCILVGSSNKQSSRVNYDHDAKIRHAFERLINLITGWMCGKQINRTSIIFVVFCYRVCCRTVPGKLWRNGHGCKHQLWYMLIILWHVDPLLDNDSVNTFPAVTNTQATIWWLFVAMKRSVNTSMEEEAFYMWFAYIYFWESDVFSSCPPRDCTEPNQMRLRLRTRMERVFRQSFTVSCCNRLWLRVIVQEGVNESNPEPVIISHGAINAWQCY
jgi:hypothetical protein